MLRRLLSAAVLLALAFAPGDAVADRDSFDLWDDKTVVAALEAGEDALEKELGSRPAKQVRVLLSSREFFEEIAFKAVKRMEGLRGPQDDRVLRYKARALSYAAFGYYEAKKNTVHLLPENFASFAREKKNDAFTKSAFLQIVLVHELAHAWAHQRYKSIDRAEATRDPEQYKVWYALIEGHAEWVSARAARRSGLEKEYRMFTEASFFPPPGLSPAESQFAWQATASMRFGYVDGHRFFTTLEASDDPKIVDKVFETPPSSVSLILHPTRLFVPEETASFPPVVDTVAALDAALQREVPGATPAKGGYDLQMVKTRLQFLPPAKTNRLLAQVVQVTARTATTRDGAFGACDTMQMTEREGAKEMFDALLENQVMEDKAVSQLTGAERKTLSGPLRARSPLLHDRQIRFPGTGADVQPEYTVLFVKDTLVVECALSARKRKWTDGQLEDLISFLLPKVAASKPAPTPGGSR